jgi:hypothetical protein
MRMTETMTGTYALKFSGFARSDRAGGKSYSLVGVGTLTLTKTSTSGNESGTASGMHRSTLNPMTGMADPNDRRHHTTYDYTNATYTVTTAGPPIVAEVKITFQERGTGRTLDDTFVCMQDGPDKFWLISSNPTDANGKVDEVVIGEAVKVDPATW